VSRDGWLYLVGMLEACEHVARFAAATTADRYLTERLFQAAIERELFILGEAAKHVPEEIRLGLPELPWREMAGLRDVLGHDYFGIDDVTVWRVATDNLPRIAMQLRDALAQRERDLP
jgi:uncharacterized protein with HEPN domain